MSSPSTSEQHTGREAHRQEAGEKLPFFESHRWAVPAVVYLSIVVSFGAMLLLTWVAGGGTPFRG